MPHFYILYNSRNLRLLIGLSLLDTSLSHNDHAVTKIKREALGSGLFEAFLESVPQLILQCSIIMRTGNTSKFCHNFLA
jgi:hypothetical protein